MRSPGRSTAGSAAITSAPRAEQRRRRILAAILRPGAAGAATLACQGERPYGAVRQGGEIAAGTARAVRRPCAAAIAVARRPMGRQRRLSRRRHAGGFRSRGLLWRAADRSRDDANCSAVFPKTSTPPTARTPAGRSYRVRKTLYQLYHVLNHAHLFGGGYAAQAERMMDRLLAEV